MKRLMILDQRGSLLLSDLLNQRIVRELALSPYSTTELSRKLGMPPVKVWRRVSQLLEARVIEQCKLEHVGNLEKKVYRAAALKYVPHEFLNFEPRSKSLREAYKSYLEIQREIMKDIEVSNEIPQSASMNPIDYGVYADLKGFCRIMQSPRTQAKIQRLDKQLAECNEFETIPQVVS
jgi:DNA-binding Lrp family transcriptional regulator